MKSKIYINSANPFIFNSSGLCDTFDIMKKNLPAPVTSFPGLVSDEDVHRFQEKGYLAWNNVLSEDEVAEARKGLSQIIEEHAFNEDRSLFRPSKNGGNASFKSRSTNMFFETEAGYQPSPEQRQDIELKVRKLMWFEKDAPIFQEIAFKHPKIRQVLSAILGEGFTMFQSMALLKPPFLGSEKPWHQDNAYFSVTPLDAIVGIWIALDPATAENGCMHVLEGAHKTGALRHHHDKDCEIMEDRLDPSAAVPVELKPGGVLFFYGMLPHQTPPNASPDRRRALQFHYHAAHARAIDAGEYDKVFAESDGTPASCAAAREAGI